MVTAINDDLFTADAIADPYTYFGRIMTIITLGFVCPKQNEAKARKSTVIITCCLRKLIYFS